MDYLFNETRKYSSRTVEAHPSIGAPSIFQFILDYTQVIRLFYQFHDIVSF